MYCTSVPAVHCACIRTFDGLSSKDVVMANARQNNDSFLGTLTSVILWTTSASCCATDAAAERKDETKTWGYIRG